LRPQEYGQARSIYLAALDEPEVTPELGAKLRSNIAWCDLMIGDPTLRDEADRFSRLALEELPWPSGVKATRGAVLIDLGRADEGVPLVEQSLRKNDGRSGKAIDACWLAIAAAKRGNDAQARKFIDEAARHDPTCPLLKRAAAELEQGAMTTGR
jgi:hypothetical protein